MYTWWSGVYKGIVITSLSRYNDHWTTAVEAGIMISGKLELKLACWQGKGEGRT